MKAEELKKVVGGGDTETYNYHFTYGDWVNVQADGSSYWTIMEDVKTNDKNYRVHCVIESRGGCPTPMSEERTHYACCCDIMSYYHQFGGLVR